MRKSNRFMGIFLLGLLVFLVIACKPERVTAPPGAQKPVEAERPAGKADWEVKWEKVLKEARKEGTVVVYGPPISDVRRGFTEVFQKAYPGITLEYTGMSGSQTSPKISSERRAGLYVVDLHIGGTTTMLTHLKEYLLPIKPFLILPEVIDPKAWMGGKLDFSDNAEELNLVFTINANSRIVYNTELVNPQEIISWWDLTKPQWKGKIIMWDPRAAGSGLATATFWYLEPKLGLDYIRALATNRPALTRDQRLQAEEVARGRHLISISPGTSEVFEFQKLSMPIKFAEILKEGTYSSAAYGSVALLKNAPHLNAATVFLNWLLSKQGQSVWTVKGGYASRRLDAPIEHLLEAERPKAGAAYQPNYKEDIVMKKDEVLPHLIKIFAGF